MFFEELDKLNQQISSLNLSIVGGDYQVRKSVVPENWCDALTMRIFDRLFNVGASRFSLRLVSEKRGLHPSTFINCRTGTGNIDHVSVRDRVVNDVLREGGTFVFDQSQEYFVELQIIQEHLEASLGCKCWIQCFVTKSQDSAFGMHGDDHPFMLLQLMGTKKWVHGDLSDSSVTANIPEIIYAPGDIAFYPRGELHNVSGTGDFSVHLAIVFDGFDGKLFNELTVDEKHRNLTPRIGTSLPYSVCDGLVSNETSVRLAYSHLPPIYEKHGSFALVETEYGRVKIPKQFVEVLEWIKLRRNSSSRDISEKFDIDAALCVTFLNYGLQNSLFVLGLGE